MKTRYENLITNPGSWNSATEYMMKREKAPGFHWCSGAFAGSFPGFPPRCAFSVQNFQIVSFNTKSQVG